MFRADLCNYSDAYIFVKRVVTVTNPDNAKNWINKSVASKNNVPLINWISKTNNVLIDNAEDLDVALPMYNLLEYIPNYRKTAVNLWIYCRYKPSNPLFFSSESFKYKKSITGNTYNFLDCDGEYDAEKVRKNEAEIFAPLKHLNNSWRTLEIPLINCEIEMILTWSKNSVLPDMAVRAAGNNDKPTAIVAPNGLEFQLKDTKLYVPFVSLSKKDDKILLKQLKSWYKWTIKWKKYRTLMTIPTNKHNLNYLIDPTFTKVNRLFVLPLKRIAWENYKTNDHRHSFFNWLLPYVETKKLKFFIDGKSFFELPVKTREEVYEKKLLWSKITQLVIY